jgi:hypothetical protein
VSNDDVIKHFDFQQLARPNQIARHFDVGFRWCYIPRWVCMSTMAAALPTTATRETSHGCTNTVAYFDPFAILPTGVNHGNSISNEFWTAGPNVPNANIWGFSIGPDAAPPTPEMRGGPEICKIS